MGVYRRQVASNDGSGAVTATFGRRFPNALPGSLLVAVAFCRGDIGNDPTPDFGVGWTIRVLRNTMIANASFRRGLAVASRIADGTETSVTVNYNAQAGNDIRVELLELAGGTFTFLDAGSNDNGTTSDATSVATGTAEAGAAASVLLIGVMGGRVGASSPRLQGAAQWTEQLTDIYDSFVNANNTRSISTAWAVHTFGGSKTSTATVSPTGGNSNTGLSGAILAFDATPNPDPGSGSVARFGGGALPAGWSQTTPLGSSLDHSPGHYSRLLVDAGQTLNRVGPSVTAHEGPGVSVPTGGGAFDYAVALALSVMCAEQQGIDLLATGTGDTAAQVTQHFTTGTQESPSWAAFHRWASGNAAVATVDPAPDPLRGPPSWTRLAWDGVDTFTFWASHTGRAGQWAQVAQWTSEVAPDTFWARMSVDAGDTDARELRIGAVVDLAARGSDDATVPFPAATASTVESIDFTGQTTLPGWLTADTGPDATVVVQNDAAELAIDMNTTSSFAWLLGPQNLPPDHGLIVNYTLPTGAGVINAFFVPIIRSGLPPTSLPASQILPDKYRPGTGLVGEVSGSGAAAGQTLRMLDAHPVNLDEDYTVGEFNGFSHLIFDTQGPVNHFLAGRMWMQVEAVGPHWRARWWRHGNDNPITWHYTGTDFTQIDGVGIALVWAHNDGTTGDTAATALIHSVEVYELQALQAAGSGIGYGGGFSGAVTSKTATGRGTGFGAGFSRAATSKTAAGGGSTSGGGYGTADSIRVAGGTGLAFGGGYGQAAGTSTVRNTRGVTFGGGFGAATGTKIGHGRGTSYSGGFSSHRRQDLPLPALTGTVVVVNTLTGTVRII